MGVNNKNDILLQQITATHSVAVICCSQIVDKLA